MDFPFDISVGFKQEKQLFFSAQPLLSNPELLQTKVNELVQRIEQSNFPQKEIHVCGIDSRGYILGGMIASAMKVPFHMIAKSGKLPDSIESVPYDKEYGRAELDASDKLCISKKVMFEDCLVVIVDDIIATGSTMNAAYDLVDTFRPFKILKVAFVRTSLYDENDVIVNYDLFKTPLTVVTVASRSSLKMKAVKDAFNDNGSCYICVIGSDSYSDVPNQPRDDQIRIGAENRLKHAIKECSSYSDVIVSMESGITTILGEFVDICYIILHHVDSITREIVMTKTLSIPDELKHHVFGDDETIGTIISPYTPDDPHMMLTGISRREFITSAIRSIVTE